MATTVRPRPHRAGGDAAAAAADPSSAGSAAGASSEQRISDPAAPQRRKQQPSPSSPSRTQRPAHDSKRRTAPHGANATAAAAGVAAAALLAALFLFGMLVKLFDSASATDPSSSLSGGGNSNSGARTSAATKMISGGGAVRRNTGQQATKGGGRDSSNDGSSASASASCPYASIRDLTDLERHPKATSSRHIVDPPRTKLAGVHSVGEEEEEESANTTPSKLTLVCCRTTKGPWSIAVHEAWAPIGSRRFLDMVRANYFEGHPNDQHDQGVPLMRCVPKFLCQFGLAGKRSEQFQQSLVDDPQWLPAGPDHRLNKLGVKRFAKGYLSYAGGGPNSRDNQLFVALADNGPLGGGSPWEVPWGELVGNHSYETLDRIHTGYGENGPSQHLLWQDQSLPVVHKEFPLLDWIVSCHVVDEVVEDD
jgi:peptidyl-prolyl cis-trans isomerase A (cyclophilin A)